VGAGADRHRRRRPGISGRDVDARELQGVRRAGVRVGVRADLRPGSRETRENNADLLRLLEFCALTDTPPVDIDGIYDLQDFNDSMILGCRYRRVIWSCPTPSLASLGMVRNDRKAAAGVLRVQAWMWLARGGRGRRWAMTTR